MPEPSVRGSSRGDTVVAVTHLSRHFGNKAALHDVSVAVGPGTVFGLVGENGAGKSTLLKHLLGLWRAETGTVRVFGQNPVTDPVSVLGRIGYLSEQPELPGWMRVTDLLRYTQAFYPRWDTNAPRACGACPVVTRAESAPVTMNTLLAVLAALLSVLALYLPARTQAFTRVSIDGRTLRMLVTGRGGATVVFENGAGAPLETWGKVQPEVSRFARTVSYDRAGVGLSDDGPRPRDGRRIAAELRRALLLAGIAPPYILVGASFGGPYTRVFAGMYPDDVAGMVLVDPTTDNQRFEDAAGAPALESSRKTLDQSRASRVPSGIPVFLIDAVSPLEVPFATKAIRTLRMNNRPEIEADSLEYRRWLDQISGSRLIVTNRSGHNVPIEQPDLVVATIREAVDAAARRLHLPTSSP